MRVTRRDMLSGILASLAAPGVLGGESLAATGGLVFGKPQPFSFDLLKAKAAALAQTPWTDPRSPQSATLQLIDYSAYNAITFRKQDSLWANTASGAPVQLFHLGRYFQEPCSIFAVQSGTAREVLYRQSYFDIPVGNVARTLPDGIGFAGFRIMAEDQTWDWLSFLGASYFRAPSQSRQYGMSARGLAIDTALASGEEFPRFSAFWLEAVPGRRDQLTVYALLEGPSITGAYRFACSRGDGIVQDVDLEIWPRRAIERIGIAPLTSMFWYGEMDRRAALDWRPEIHDSDGLAIFTGGGERIWRPLNDPPRIMTNSFLDENPKGFGLLQRDRNFDHYQDDGVFYDRRPSTWVEPLGDWGKGAVQLVEIPTDDETHDNIVAYWVPADPVPPGQSLSLRYRLHWRDDEPYPGSAGREIAGYTGLAGVPGLERPENQRKIVTDFAGGRLGDFSARDGVRLEVTVSRGTVHDLAAYPVVGQPGIFRSVFDLAIIDAEPIDIRLYLSHQGEALTETVIRQYFPGNPGTSAY